MSYRPLLVSFSGIDGAGKTTQIEMLASWLRDAGLRVRSVRFWDDVALLRGTREAVGHALFKGDRGVGARGKPVRRRDKNVRSWYMAPVRLVLCLLDALGLAIAMSRIRRSSDADIIIFDRYLYDQVANLNLQSRVTRRAVGVLLKIVPCPDVSLLLDADPILACERKPEYPLSFLVFHRSAYLTIARMAGMNVIPAGMVEDVEDFVRRKLREKLVQEPPVPGVLTSR